MSESESSSTEPLPDGVVMRLDLYDFGVHLVLCGNVTPDQVPGILRQIADGYDKGAVVGLN